MSGNENAPATYRGIPVPDDWGPVVDLDDWKQGVDAALATMTGLIADFMDGTECDPDGDDTSSCREHGWFDAVPCPHDRARKLIDALKDGGEDVEDDPLRGPVCTDPGCPAGYPHHGPCPGEGDR